MSDIGSRAISGKLKSSVQCHLAKYNGKSLSGMQELIDALPFYMLVIDSDHCIVMANRAVSDTFGVEPKSVIGGYCPAVIHGLDKPFPGCPLEEATRTGKISEKELYDEKTERWTLFSVYPTGLRTQEGKDVFLHMAKDITETKKASELIEENQLKANLLDVSTDSIFVCDLEGNFVYVNDAAYKTRGYESKEDLMSINLKQLDVPEYAKLIESRIKELLKKGESTFETAHLRKDRSIMPVEVHSRLLKVNGSRLILGVVRDISNRKEAERKVMEEKGFTEAVIKNLPGIFFLIHQETYDDGIKMPSQF